MRPTLYDLRVDPILSNVSVAFQNEEYIAEKILPVIKVKGRTGLYYKYDTSKFRKEFSLRGMGAAAKEVDYGISQSTAFVVKDHALKELVPDELVEQALAPLTPEIDAVENVTEKMLIEKEYDLATYMKVAANNGAGSGSPCGNGWDVTGSTPLAQVLVARKAIHAKIFKEPNVLLLGKEVYDALIDHADIVDRIKYSALGVATTELLARIFNVQQVIIGAAGYESAREGQTSSMAYIWGKYAWLLYVAPRPGIKQISFGYHFQDKLRVVDKWYDKEREGTWVRVHDSYTREIVSADCAYVITDAVT